MKNKSKELEVAIAAVKKGSEYALKYYGKVSEVSYKEDNTPFSHVDETVEEIIKKEILREFPNAKFVGEESGGSIDEKEFWIIDPIDATKAYLHEIPHWAILLALYRNKTIELGVSYLPAMDELGFAQRGHGTFINDRKVHVSDCSSIDKAFLIGPAGLRRIKKIQEFFNVAQKSYWTRAMDQAMAFHFLCGGKIDAITQEDLKLWDFAPSIVMLEEAGGKITDDQGKPWNLKTTDIIATNGLLHDEIVKTFNQK